MTALFRLLLFAALAFGAASGTVLAQATEEDGAFLNDILEATGQTSGDETREAYVRCTELSKKLAGRSNVDPLQRLYFETEIENCLFAAMNNGKFSDGTGNSCSHHLAYAMKLSEVIRRGSERRVFAPELMQNFASRLESAISYGPQFGCTADYEVFRPAAEIAKAAAAVPLPEPDFGLWQQIMDVRNAITGETAREALKTCRTFTDAVTAKPGRPPAESIFLESEIDNCVATALDKGKFDDEMGDACTHHFAHATKLVEALNALKDDPLYASQIEGVIRAELEMAAEQGPAMGCKHDYGSLKVD